MTYPEFVSSLAKPGEEILHSLDPRKCNLIHIAMGLSGEAGEYLDTVKKHTMYDKPLNEEMQNNLHEEVGDKLFFIQMHCNHFNIPIQSLIEQNRQKLEERYHEGKYSDQQAQERADKQ